MNTRSFLLRSGFFLISALMPAIGSAAIAIASPDFPDLVEKVLPGVVNVSSISVSNTVVYGMDDFMNFFGIPREQKQTSLGSGVLMDSEGYVLTNSHVVEGAREVLITLIDKRQFRAKLIGHDQKTDLALLQIRNDAHAVPSGLKPLTLGDSDSVRIAEPVFAVGNPFGLQHTVTAGIISAKNRTIGMGPFDNFLQTDASINPGNSGGPLFNLKGQVIGINSVIFSKTGQSGGLGFAIPANEAKTVLIDLKRFGRVPRPWLGIFGQPVTAPLAEYYEIPTQKGVIIANLVESAPAQNAGIRRGDVLVTLDGESVADENELERVLYKHKPQDSAKVGLFRGKKKLELSIKLQELPRLERIPRGIL